MPTKIHAPRPGIRIQEDGPDRSLSLWCPACGVIHGPLPLRPSDLPGPSWSWDEKTATLDPSVKHYHTRPDGSEQVDCHYFVRGGRIEYCGDNPHALNGCPAELDKEPPEGYGGREAFGWRDG